MLGHSDCFLLYTLLHLPFLFVSAYGTDCQDVTTAVGGKATLRCHKTDMSVWGVYFHCFQDLSF